MFLRSYDDVKNIIMESFFEIILLSCNINILMGGRNGK